MMTPGDWRGIKHFKPFSKWDHWGDPWQMDLCLVKTIDKLRDFIGKPVFIHCGCEPRTTGGYHPAGRAADLHIEGLHVVDQYIVATRFDEFNGIGIYPFWNRPGLHVDTRPRAGLLEGDARWAKNEEGLYVNLDWDFLRSLA